MMKHAFHLWRYLLPSLAIGSVVLSGCSSTPTPNESQKLLHEILAREVQEEVQIGREMAAKLLGHFREHRKSPQATLYLNLVGHSLARRWGRPELKYTFGILDTDVINAYATPGGYIFVTRGLLENLRSESELVLVLGHEIAHINEKHMYEQIAPKREVSAGETMVRLMSRGSSDISGSLNQIVEKGMKILLEEGIDEKYELQADAAGLTYAASMGYSGAEFIAFLERMRAHPKNKVKGMTVGFEKRLSHAKTFLSKNGLEDATKTQTVDQTVVSQRFSRGLASLQKKR